MDEINEDATISAPAKVLLCSEHGMGVGSSAQLYDVTSHLFTPESSSQEDEQELVKQAKDLPQSTLGNEM